MGSVVNAAAQSCFYSLFRRPTRLSSDTDGLGLDVRPQLFSERLIGDQINRPTQKVLDIELPANLLSQSLSRSQSLTSAEILTANISLEQLAVADTL